MIELRWRKAEDDDPNGVINGLILPLPLVVLQYRESLSETLVDVVTGDRWDNQNFDGVEWQDVPIQS